MYICSYVESNDLTRYNAVYFFNIYEIEQEIKTCAEKEMKLTMGSLRKGMSGCWSKCGQLGQVESMRDLQTNSALSLD